MLGIRRCNDKAKNRPASIQKNPSGKHAHTAKCTNGVNLAIPSVLFCPRLASGEGASFTEFGRPIVDKQCSLVRSRRLQACRSLAAEG